MIKLLKDFLNLFYPEVCFICGHGLSETEECLCTSCIYKLPKTEYHKTTDNPLLQSFNGRAKIKAAAAYSFYIRGTELQYLIHEMKYSGKREVAVCFGKWYGAELKKSPLFADIDYIVPVPLHPKKLMSRSFNQSACFAEGLSQVMNLPVLPDALKRIKNTETQTNKSRFSRWENVKDVFEVMDKQQVENKRILMVDDIITTGATMEACVNVLNSVNVASVSIASIGYVSTGIL